jgi:hypothetical protein
MSSLPRAAAASKAAVAAAPALRSCAGPSAGYAAAAAAAALAPAGRRRATPSGTTLSSSSLPSDRSDDAPRAPQGPPLLPWAGVDAQYGDVTAADVEAALAGGAAAVYAGGGKGSSSLPQPQSQPPSARAQRALQLWALYQRRPHPLRADVIGGAVSLYASLGAHRLAVDVFQAASKAAEGGRRRTEEDGGAGGGGGGGGAGKGRAGQGTAAAPSSPPFRLPRSSQEALLRSMRALGDPSGHPFASSGGGGTASPSSSSSLLHPTSASTSSSSATSLSHSSASSFVPADLPSALRALQTAASAGDATRAVGLLRGMHGRGFPLPLAAYRAAARVSVDSGQSDRAVHAARELVRKRRRAEADAALAAPDGAVDADGAPAALASSAAQDRETIVRPALLAAVKAGDGDGAAVAYHAARALGFPFARGGTGAIERRQVVWAASAAALLASPVLGEAVVADLLRAGDAVDGLSPPSGAAGGSSSSSSAAAAAGAAAATSSSAAARPTPMRHGLPSETPISTPQELLSHALNSLVVACAGAGDVVGAVRTLCLLLGEGQGGPGPNGALLLEERAWTATVDAIRTAGAKFLQWERMLRDQSGEQVQHQPPPPQEEQQEEAAAAAGVSIAAEDAEAATTTSPPSPAEEATEGQLLAEEEAFEAETGEATAADADAGPLSGVEGGGLSPHPSSSSSAAAAAPAPSTPLTSEYALLASLFGSHPLAFGAALPLSDEEALARLSHQAPVPASLNPDGTVSAEVLRRERPEALSAAAAGYSPASYLARLVFLGAAEAHALRQSPGGWRGVLQTTVEEAEARILGASLVGRGPTLAGGGASSNPAATSSPPSSSSSSSSSASGAPLLLHDHDLAPLDPAVVPALTISALLARQHGGAAQPLPAGNFQLFATISQTLGLTPDARGPSQAEGAPPLPGPVLSAAVVGMASHRAARKSAPQVAEYAVRVLSAQPDADTYAGMLMAHAREKKEKMDMAAAAEVLRRATAAGVRVTRRLYGEMAVFYLRTDRPTRAREVLADAIQAGETPSPEVFDLAVRTAAKLMRGQQQQQQRGGADGGGTSSSAAAAAGSSARTGDAAIVTPREFAKLAADAK